jgi:hypothetical protein
MEQGGSSRAIAGLTKDRDTTMTISEKPRSGCVQWPCLCRDMRESRSAKTEMGVFRLPLRSGFRTIIFMKGFK